MNRSRLFFVAAEGIPFLFAIAVVLAAVWQFQGTAYATIPAAVFIYLYLIFRDPTRDIPSSALGVLSPVDGKVVETGASDGGLVDSAMQRIVIRVSSLGAYTARAPVEGKVMDLNAAPKAGALAGKQAGLWLLTDEGENVILRFRGNRFGLAPRAFLRYGERVGQGQRCAYLRLTRFAILELPQDARVLVAAGKRVSAGEDVLAKLPSD